MRSGKSLVQIQVHHIDAKIARPHLAHQRVHIGAVHVEQSALGVQNRGDLGDVLLENSQRVGIGQHERGNIFAHLRLQSGDIHHAARIRFQVFDGIVDHRRRRRIRSMRGVWNQNFFSRASLRMVISPHHEQTGHLAMRAGGGLQRDCVHARDFDQALAQRFQNLQRALRNLLRLVGMPVRQSLHARHRFIHPRVVLHRA